MTLQRIQPGMVDGGTASVGEVLGKISNQGVGFFTVGANSQTPESGQAEFDALTGTLTILFPDGSQASVSGLPTTDQMKSGREGKQGSMGLPGRPGTNGRDGKDGDPGCPGPKGSPGRMGPTGNTGAIGPTGDTGAPGPTGPTGPTGVPGRDSLINEYVVSPVLDAITGNPIVGAYQGSFRDPNSGYTRNFGRHKAPAANATVNVLFNTAFVNRCVALNITFLNVSTNQSRTFRIYNLDGTAVNENLLLGGFVLRSDGQNVQEWDFFYAAEGD